MARVVDKDQLKPALKLGFDLIPIKKWDAQDGGRFLGKAPRDNRWVVQEYQRAEILEWIKEGGNVGVRLRRDELVIDVDPKHEDAKGRTADMLIDELELELGIDLSAAPVVQTGSGGLHVYLKKDPDARVRNSVPLFGGAIEFKSYGRQVLAAGSKHPNANYYKWVRNQDGPVLPCPAPLLALIRKPDLPQRERVEGEELTLEVLEKCLSQLDPTKFQDYEKWRNLMFSVHYACNGSEEGREAFIKWSTGDPKYAGARESIDTFWEYATDNRSDARTEKTLFYYVGEVGGTVPLNIDTEFPDELEQPLGEDEPRPDPKFDREKSGKIKHTVVENVIMACDCLGLGLLEDEFSGKLSIADTRGFLHKNFEEVKHGDEYTDRVTDLVMLTLRRHEWQGPGFAGDPSESVMRRAENGIVKPHHPLRKWLQGLKWDKTPRLETWLIERSDLEDTRYNRAVSRLMIYSAVARVMKPGIKYDTMIILEGPQGGYKSTLIKFLGGEYAAEGLPPIGGYNDKDVVIAMRGKWLIEIEELASMKKADVDVLKSFISKTEDRIRLPYESKTRTLPRQCVFIGTTNDAEYLRDPTGNRRFLPIKVGMIHDVFGIEREQLWAEAMHVWTFNPDKEISLPLAARDAAEEEQERRRVRDPWEDKLQEFLLEKYADETFLSTDLILHECLHLALHNARPTDYRRLAQAMQKLQWDSDRGSINGRQVRGYRRRKGK